MPNVIRYLPTNKFHIIPLYGLAPEALKQSAKECFRDRERLAHTSVLNLLAKSLGAREGFSGYRRLYETRLAPFMERHGLIHRVDLLKPSSSSMAVQELSVEQVSGRLFYSGRPLPQKIFTGYNFDYHGRYDDGIWEFNQWVGEQGKCPPSIGGQDFNDLVSDARFDPYRILGAKKKRLRDMVLGGYALHSLYPNFNLLGDLLVEPVLSELSVPKVYWPLDVEAGKRKIEEEGHCNLASLFREEIESCRDGWVDVIKFNEKLIFLKGDNGQYDFVIPGLRSKPFEHQIYEPFLKRADVPSQMNEAYHFQRWYYFEFDGWREQAFHHAEQDYYESGGTVADYPGEWEVLRASLLRRKRYEPCPGRLDRPGSSPLSFYNVQLDGKRLYVSELVPVAEIAKLLEKNPHYSKRRKSIQENAKLDNLTTMNFEPPELPAAVTWFDACAYMADFEERYQLPVRLLKISEYLELRNHMPGSLSDDLGITPAIQSDGLIEFTDGRARNYGSMPPYMAEADFNALQCRFAKPLEFIEHPVGLRFVNSDCFGEWLYENPTGSAAAAVRSRSLRSIHGSSALRRECFPANSTGKYKYIKIGFRLCFEANH